MDKNETIHGVSTSLPHREGQRESLTIVKVGGAVVEDELQLSQLLRDFSAIEGRKVLVHGGGRKATKMAERLGIETKMVNGRRWKWSRWCMADWSTRT